MPDLLPQRSHLQLCNVSKDPIGHYAEQEIQRIGQVVASLREYRSLTQDELWQLAGISYSQVKRLERGRGDPAMSFYIRIAKALDVPLYWLFTEEWPRFLAELEAGKE